MARITLSVQPDPRSGPYSPLGSLPPELERPLLASLIHDFPLGVVLFDATGRFLFVNDAAAKLNGLPAEEHVGRHIREVVPDLWEEAEPVLRRVLQGEVVEWEISGETPAAPNVTRHWAEQWFPLRNHEGGVAAVAGTILEITEQVQARAAVEETAEMRDRLIHVISHELRGPMANILGYAQLSLRHDDIDQIRNDLRIIYEQAVQMRERLELFVTLSDLEGLDNAPIDVQTVDLVGLVERELSVLRTVHPGLSVGLVRNGEAIVQTDASLLQQVLNSLLDNAAKYGGPRGSVTARVVPTLSGAVIEIHDDGPGIAREQQRRLFDPGFRTNEAKKSGKEGEGLGLFVAKKLSTRLGGTLSVVSELGSGASFFLHLPRHPGAGETGRRRSS